MTEHVPQSGMLDKAALLALRETLRGKLLQPGDAQYDDARGVWNGMIDRRPGLIVRCHGVADSKTGTIPFCARQPRSFPTSFAWPPRDSCPSAALRNRDDRMFRRM